MELNLSVELINQILAYLGSRPYQEVFTLVQGIQDAAKSAQTQQEQKDDGKKEVDF